VRNPPLFMPSRSPSRQRTWGPINPASVGPSQPCSPARRGCGQGPGIDRREGNSPPAGPLSGSTSAGARGQARLRACASARAEMDFLLDKAQECQRSILTRAFAWDSEEDGPLGQLGGTVVVESLLGGTVLSVPDARANSALVVIHTIRAFAAGFGDPAVLLRARLLIE
jgi:hypothetical protein